MIPECSHCGTPLDHKWIRCPVCIGGMEANPKTPTQAHNGISGMTLRDWFAGIALNAMLSEGFQPNCLRENYGNTADFNYFRAAYAAADAMLRQRDI